MPRTLTYEGKIQTSLENVYEQFKETMESPENITDETQPYITRVEKDFGNYNRKDVFVQTEDFNAFLYKDKITFHGLEPYKENQEKHQITEQVWEHLEKAYDEQLDEKLEKLI